MRERLHQLNIVMKAIETRPSFHIEVLIDSADSFIPGPDVDMFVSIFLERLSATTKSMERSLTTGVCGRCVFNDVVRHD